MPHPPVQFDRTAVFENRLRQSGYQQLEPFFVLREGYIQDNRTGGMLKLDRARLEKIAAVQNQRIHDTGDATPIIIGHTKRNKKENEQPELTGWATRFQVTPFLDGKTYGLQAIPWSRPEKIENFERYPRRSAELWTDPDLLDPISILGANTPRLDLGLHRLQRDGIDDEVYVPRHNHAGTPLYLEMNMADEPAADSGNKPADDGKSNGGGGGGGSSALQAVFNSPEWKQMQQQISQFSELASVLMPMIQEMQGGGGAPPPGGPPGAPPPGMGGPPGAPPPGPAPEVPAQMSGHPFPQQNAGHPMPPMQQPPPPMPHQPMPAHMNMGGGGSPGGYGNTNMPAHMQRQGYDPRDATIAQLQHQVAAMQLSMIEGTVNSVLDDLEGKVVIDRPRDFARLVQMSRADMDAEVSYWLQTRKPIEQPTPPEGVPLQFQAAGNQPGAARGPMGPVQLTMSQAHDMMSMPADPTMGGPAGAPKSEYDKLVDIVRNRGKETPMAAYERVMGKMQAQTNGMPTVRG